MGDEAVGGKADAPHKGSALHWRAFWWSVVRNGQIEPHVVKGDS